MSDEEFWASSYKKLLFLIHKLGIETGAIEEEKPQEEVQTITSMRQIQGWC